MKTGSINKIVFLAPPELSLNQTTPPSVGYEGPRCDIAIDACQLNVCYNGAKCVLDQLREYGFKCECHEHYTGGV